MSNLPFDSDESLTDTQLDLERKRTAKPTVTDTRVARDKGYRAHPAARIFVRGPWEMAATIIIAVGVFMLMQPFVMWAYTYSFITTLVGTVMFIIVSHFPE
ncbi:MAG: hypothetical protein JJ992_19285 [Planctomycetes bacterium]|nr:hypothetical protein [Planctomycetota bacterium]